MKFRITYGIFSALRHAYNLLKTSLNILKKTFVYFWTEILHVIEHNFFNYFCGKK